MVMVIETQSEGGHTPPSVRTKYLDVIVGETVIEAGPLVIRVPVHAVEPVYQYNVPPPGFVVVSVVELPRHTGFKLAIIVVGVELTGVVVTVAVTQAEEQVTAFSVITVFAQYVVVTLLKVLPGGVNV
jgi:hypothetical protein